MESYWYCQCDYHWKGEFSECPSCGSTDIQSQFDSILSLAWKQGVREDYFNEAIYPVENTLTACLYHHLRNYLKELSPRDIYRVHIFLEMFMPGETDTHKYDMAIVSWNRGYPKENWYDLRKIETYSILEEALNVHMIIEVKEDHYPSDEEVIKDLERLKDLTNKGILCCFVFIPWISKDYTMKNTVRILEKYLKQDYQVPILFGHPKSYDPDHWVLLTKKDTRILEKMP